MLLYLPKFDHPAFVTLLLLATFDYPAYVVLLLTTLAFVLSHLFFGQVLFLYRLSRYPILRQRPCPFRNHPPS